MKMLFKILLLFFIITAPAISQWKRVKTIPPPYDNTYWLDVYFLPSNSNFGWCCGYDGYTIRTTDGGDTWQGSQVSDLFIDSVYTNNGFRYDTTFDYKYNQLESIHFVNEKIGYTSGLDLIFKTIDGGRTWDLALKTQMRVWGNYFISADTGVAVGGGCDMGDPMEFHRTEDGGNTWTTYTNSSVESGLTDAILYSADGLGYAVSSGLIWRTDDGGRTWYILSVSGGVDWQEEIAHKGKSFLVPYSKGCSGSVSSGVQGGGFRFTTNYGASWRQFDVGAPQFGTFLQDSLRGWGCGWNKAIYYTSDGGINWELKDCGIELGASLDDIWFINDTLGWVVGDHVYKTAPPDTIQSKIASNGKNKFCNVDSVLLQSDGDYNHYLWSNGETTKYIYVKQSGTYTLESYNFICDTRYPDTIQIEIYPETKVELLADKPSGICHGDSVLLWTNNTYNDINWSTNEYLDTIIVKKEGYYTVTITDTNGCQSSESIYVIVNPKPDIKITASGKTGFCEGYSVELSVSNDFESYQWFEKSNPDSIISNDNSIIVNKSGFYSIIVTNEFGCSDTSESIEVQSWDIENRLEIMAEDNQKFIDFDSVSMTSTICLPVKISNLSDIPLTFSNIYLYHNIEFSIPLKQIPIIIYPGIDFELIICFHPWQLGIAKDTLLIGDTCDSHIVPLIGTGKENIYNSFSDCNLELKFETSGMIDGTYFNTSKAYPNPATGAINVDYLDISSSDNSIIKCKLNDILGNVLSENRLSPQSIKNNNNYIRVGTFNLNVENFSNGIYYLEITNGTHSKTIPISIIK